MWLNYTVLNAKHNIIFRIILSILTVDHSSRVGISVCSMSDASTTQFIRLLYCHVFSVSTVHHTVGVAVPTAGGEHTTRQTGPIVVHIVQTRTLQSRQSLWSVELLIYTLLQKMTQFLTVLQTQTAYCINTETDDHSFTPIVYVWVI